MKKLIWSGLMLLVAGVWAGELRCVSLSPALTELVCHLQKEHCLIGRSVSCDRPVSVKKLPVAGDFAKPDLEKLAKLKPDLVLADNLQYRGLPRNHWLMPWSEILVLLILQREFERYKAYEHNLQILF